MKKSAGILPYKIINNKLYVYLEHPGGPYWKNIDKWSICKGELNNESIKSAAIREFKEETGTEIKIEELQYLCSRKISRQKLVIIFVVNKDIDSTKMQSNTFKLESPKGSGIFHEYPEMDKASWFEINEAEEKIMSSQKYFLQRLKDMIKL